MSSDSSSVSVSEDDANKRRRRARRRDRDMLGVFGEDEEEDGGDAGESVAHRALKSAWKSRSSRARGSDGEEESGGGEREAGDADEDEDDDAFGVSGSHKKGAKKRAFGELTAWDIDMDGENEEDFIPLRGGLGSGAPSVLPGFLPSKAKPKQGGAPGDAKDGGAGGGGITVKPRAAATVTFSQGGGLGSGSNDAFQAAMGLGLGASAPSAVAAPKKKKPAVPPPEAEKIGSFEAHTRGIGAKLLQSMGWKKGEGLGRDGKGLV